MISLLQRILEELVGCVVSKLEEIHLEFVFLSIERMTGINILTLKSSIPAHCFTGIFAYLNYLVTRDRKFVIDTLIKGLQRLEYRGYDSAGEFLNIFADTFDHGTQLCTSKSDL